MVQSSDFMVGVGYPNLEAARDQELDSGATSVTRLADSVL
jgi:hypothetical protein